jgi:hypothetical protein
MTILGDIRMTGEMRTDYDCETSGLPAERWAEAVFGDEEVVMEISVEKDVIVSIIPTFQWRPSKSFSPNKTVGIFS